MCSYLDLQQHGNCTSSIPWCLLIWSLLLWSTLDFTHWWNLVFLWLLRLSSFENKNFLLFESVFVISWLEHYGNCYELSVMTTPFLFLASSSSHIMPCLALGRESRSVMDHSISEVRKPLWCITSKEGKKMPRAINPRLGILLLKDKKLLYTGMIDFSRAAFQLLSFRRWGWSNTCVTSDTGNEFCICSFHGSSEPSS